MKPRGVRSRAEFLVLRREMATEKVNRLAAVYLEANAASQEAEVAAAQAVAAAEEARVAWEQAKAWLAITAA